MIDIEKLRHVPRGSKEKYKPPPVLKDSAVVNNMLKQVVREKIDDVVRAVQKPIRFYDPVRRWTLLEVRKTEQPAKHHYSYLYDLGINLVGRVESGHLQRLVYEVMRDEYGLPSEDKSKLTKVEDVYRNPKIVRERRDFPSQKIKGLVFEREKVYYAETGEPVSFGWNVSDKDAPKVRIDIFSRKQVEPSLAPR